MMATILPESGSGVVSKVKRWPKTRASSSVGLSELRKAFRNFRIYTKYDFPHLLLKKYAWSSSLSLRAWQQLSTSE